MSWNPGKQELYLLAESQLAFNALPIEVLLVNEQEWAMVDLVQPALTSHIPTIVVTNGNQGGRIISKGQETHFSSQSIPSVDDTGAGDAFAVGFVCGYIWQQPLDICAAIGAKNAASVVGHIGAKPGLLRKGDLLH